ncbi:unnamed protein product [Pleuronectes platessa]|uniref:Uncharacterized protein n=1 Tax=Pleuronectes platessa TaxID=8262 RepID=A0A9N7TH09_PLEPL|nr:unnamed protein product [Pleuronectes platessa]
MGARRGQRQLRSDVREAWQRPPPHKAQSALIALHAELSSNQPATQSAFPPSPVLSPGGQHLAGRPVFLSQTRYACLLLTIPLSLVQLLRPPQPMAARLSPPWRPDRAVSSACRHEWKRSSPTRVLQRPHSISIPEVTTWSRSNNPDM